MTVYNLVVSNPPQDGVLIEEAAQCLSLTAEEVRGKVAYSVPEIWYAHPTRDKAERAAGALRAAGCRVVLISSDDVQHVPEMNRVRSFAFTGDGMVLHLDTADLMVAYDSGMVAVSCRPRETATDLRSSGWTSRPSGMTSFRDRLTERTSTSGGWAQPDMPNEIPFFDIYLANGSGPRRVTVVQNAVDFSGLGHVQPRAASNMAALVEQCEDRFRRGAVDRRLEGMRLRHRMPTKRAPGYEHRKGFSFASPALDELLADASPDLTRVTQSEFSVRLAYLTKRGAA